MYASSDDSVDTLCLQTVENIRQLAFLLMMNLSERHSQTSLALAFAFAFTFAFAL